MRLCKRCGGVMIPRMDGDRKYDCSKCDDTYILVKDTIYKKGNWQDGVTR